MQEGLGIDACTEVEPTLRHAADHTRLGCQRQVVEYALLGSDGGDHLRYADPEIDHAAQRQFESTSAGDQLALIQRRSRNTVRADADLAGVGGVVGGPVRLSVRAFRGEDHAVDQYARNHDSPGVERAARGDPLHLGDNEPVRVSCGHRGRLCVEHERLALHRDVAVGIGRRTADQRNVDRERLVEKPLLAIDVHHAHEFFGRARVDPSAARPGIDKRPQSHLRQRSRAMRRRVTIEVRDGAQGKVVRLDLVVGRQLGQLRHQRPVASDRALDQPGPRQSIQPELLAVARRGSEDERQIARALGSRQIVALALRSTPLASRYRRTLSNSPSRHLGSEPPPRRH